MKWFNRKKELRAVEVLVREYNKSVDEICLELKEIYGGEYTTEYVNNLIHDEFNDTYLPFNPETNLKREKTCKNLMGKCNDLINACRRKKEIVSRKILEYVDICDENREGLEEKMKDGMPLFIVVEPLKKGGFELNEKNLRPSRGTLYFKNPLRFAKKWYCFCYEFKKTDNRWVYLANVVDTETAKAYNTKIDLRYASVRAMTEEEFENEYIIRRVGLMDNMTEPEIVNYDNEVRRLFHGQREVK